MFLSRCFQTGQAWLLVNGTSYACFLKANCFDVNTNKKTLPITKGCTV